jgi:23S rRNA (uracil1939-C5)-methyltransferase
MARAAIEPGGEVEVAVEELGARGDGIARADGAAIYLPFTAPGDRVRARIETRRGDGFAASVAAFVTRSADRCEPPCRHFGACGGCAWQHLNERIYGDVKRTLLTAALRRNGLMPPVEATRTSPPASRRRVRFSGERSAKGVVLGLRMRAAHDVVDLQECPVTAPAIVALLRPCREIALALDALKPARKPSAFAVAITGSDTGPDLTLTLPSAPSLADRERLARFAAEHDLARVSWRLPGRGDDAPASAEPVVVRRAPVVGPGGVAVELPPDGFLQATAAGERTIQDVVGAAVASAPKGRVADLFAGIGTLSLPLARDRAVLAVDGDEAAIVALEAAARKAKLNNLKTERRDLARRPLTAGELRDFAAAVFDPPRAGALSQARAIAASTVPVVAAVSCDPATLARDLRVLADGGYAVERVVPVDQFLWSPRIEAVAVLRR